MIILGKSTKKLIFSLIEMCELSSVRSGAPALNSRYCLISEMKAKYPQDENQEKCHIQKGKKNVFFHSTDY